MALNNHHYIYGVSVSDLDLTIERSVYERMIKMNLDVPEQLGQKVTIIIVNIFVGT
jgi:hypothetical protein